jgi:glyoxylase I family protein
MAAVTGIGGFFFRSSNPEELANWYLDNFGINLVPTDYGVKPWTQEAGATVFAPFPKDTDYFGDAGKNWMINFRVSGLDEFVAGLKGKGIEVKVDPENYPNGRFARLRDPEGNPIELWEPV